MADAVASAARVRGLAATLRDGPFRRLRGEPGLTTVAQVAAACTELPRAMTGTPRRVLIHRLGSLGDTLITLPVFHLVDRLWPGAEKRVLTNFPVAAEAPPLQTVLGAAGFANGYFAYPVGTRNPVELWALAREIRGWGPDVAVYANPCRSLAVTLRDRVFLRLCGARQIYGLPLTGAARGNAVDPATGLHEREAVQIARSLAALGDAAIDDPASRSPRLSETERREAERHLAGWPGAGCFVAFSTGTKWPENDWGDARWTALIAALAARHPGLGLVVLGSAEDRARGDALAAAWPGPALNLCGDSAPRIAAAVLERAACFVGHDSGPMHLAAAVATPAAAVFSRKNPPGIWFPLGDEHRIFYPGLAWSGGRPPVTRDAADETDIASIPPGQVADAVSAFLAAAGGRSGNGGA